MSLKKQGKYRFNDFEVDLTHRSLRRDGHIVEISPKTFDLLAFLVLHPQRAIATDALLHALWYDAFAEESTLSQHIFLLRKALTGSQSGNKLIVSIPGEGYRFNAKVSEIPQPEPHAEQRIFPPAADSAPATDDLDAEESSNLSRRFVILLRPGPLQITALVGIAVILAFGGWLVWRSLRPAKEASQQSIGLMIADFDNATGNTDFDLSISTALAIELAQSPNLRITPDQKVAKFLDETRVAAEKSGSSSPSAPPSALELTHTACRRLNDQAYLTGDIRRLAQNYLLTIRAIDCTRGSTLAESRGIAETPNAVLTVLDKVAVDLRKQLGEPRKSVEAFSKSLFADRAPSLQAFKAYADAGHLTAVDKYSDAMPLLNRAIDLDPKFALAHADLGAVHANLGQHDLAVASMTRAYELRDTVDEESRFFIVSTFNNLVTGDLQASIRNDKAWSETYPRNPAPFGNLAVLETEIGQAAQALDPARRALELDPSNPVSYEVLARAQMHLGQYEEAASTCRLAITRQLDSEEIHGFLLQIAFLRLDQAAMDEQIAWGQNEKKDTPGEPFMMQQQGMMEFAEGKVKAAHATFLKAATGYRKQGLTEQANHVQEIEPRIEADLGLPDSAHALLTRLPEIPDSVDIPVAWAAIGETTRAASLLQNQLDANPTATLWQLEKGPQVRAAIALNQHRPVDALQALQAAFPYDLRGFAVPALRGRAYLADKQPDLAEVEFQKILEHPGIEPLSHNFPLARLGLARALVQQDKLVDAGFAYKIVLQIWADADPDLPPLKAAKAEYAKLTVTPVKKSASPAKTRHK